VALHNDEVVPERAAKLYWRENVKLLGLLLTIWFAVSFGAGILFVDVLNKIEIGGFKLGFWFAQQGSIIIFVVLIFVYAACMKRIEKRYGVGDE
jgi:putative solute:sodium symporter small subunit